jgi:uncharacterized protein YacL
MLLLIIRIMYFLVCAGAIATFVNPGEATEHPIKLIRDNELVAFFVLLIASQAVTLIDILIPKKRVEVISSAYFGILIGVLLSYLLIQAIEPVFNAINKPELQDAAAMLMTLVLVYLSVSFLLQTKDDFRFVIPYVEFARELKGGRPLILDSSALIDGRIADVVETDILDSRIVVPEFILKEVQDIADSNDKQRRNRGRRGLDILSRLQNSPHAEVSVQQVDATKLRGKSVDQRLLDVGAQLNGRIVTSDFNLNKVASVHGIPTVNLNDVANALKPRFLPGEHIQIKIIKAGESEGQGVGYLDDGTMVVCESAAHLIGKDVDMVVTSVLQSSAGRMIFGRQASQTR